MFAWIAQGDIPPPELLVSFEDTFRHYLIAPIMQSENVSLEQAFFGNTKQGIGPYNKNFAKKFKKPKKYTNSGFSDFLDSLSTTEFSLPELLEQYFDSVDEKRIREYQSYVDNFGASCSQEEYLGSLEHPDPESFLRGYRRWKKRVFPDKK